ncbi:TfpX/TfpZ family type IV pilin accessory protein [Psychrobacter immobilis]|uniref:TfpX/TfpZ family type IV pilin accessory protein n=1 Tax=Psychrobacter immobilis TaxID=498 RepID=UPI001917C301|nr:TfpX/TfpZ family type IV pilin accessory protein [Psychrobacter immobilis]
MLSVAIKDKIRAAFIHLLISAVLVIASYLIITEIWYPAPFFKATDVSQIFILILIVDLILGPLLTFIVYKKNKKTLIMDLSVIALLQLSALAYGLYSVYEARPVWIAYIVDRFELVQANELIDDPEHPMILPKMGPEYRYVDITTNSISEQLEIFTTETTYGISPIQRPKFYRDFEAAKSLVIKNSLQLAALNQYNSSIKIDEILKKYPQADSFLPLTSNKDMTVLINKNKGGTVVAIVDLRPW